jgi:hypothetical protein
MMHQVRNQGEFRDGPPSETMREPNVQIGNSCEDVFDSVEVTQLLSVLNSIREHAAV